MKEKKPFWDKEETLGFVQIKACDGLFYKVWNKGTDETIKKVADILANIRYDINRLLIYLCKNKQNWENHPIAFGIYHTFNIHAPNSNEETFYSDNAMNLINSNSRKDLFNYQEMTPNDDNILGLNKPKELTNINIIFNDKKINYEIATKRSIFLTIRPKLSSNGDPNYIEKYNKILDLAIHELTHTTCNDTRWKNNNHEHPYPVYHKMMRQFAKYCNVIN
jgi:hypothetical protein